MTREMLSDFLFVAFCSFISVSDTAAEASSQQEQHAPIFCAYRMNTRRETDKRCILVEIRNDAQQNEKAMCV
jgi:hypothetical protein